MAGRRLTAEDISGRQGAVAALVAGLSPGAALAGRGDWLWVLLWSAAAVGTALLLLWRTAGRQMGRILCLLYRGWGVVLASATLGRAVSRLEVTSGGSPRFWLLVLVSAPLIWLCSGKTAPFFRAVEIYWLAVAVVLALVLAFGLSRAEVRWVLPCRENALASAMLVGEAFAPALFLLPYIYKVKELRPGRAAKWLAGLGAAVSGLCLVTAGLLGGMGAVIDHSFFVAAGLLGETSRCEGLLSVLWLIPDLTAAGLFCRVWGEGCISALAAGLSAILAATGIANVFSGIPVVFGALILLILTAIFPGRGGK